MAVVQQSVLPVDYYFDFIHHNSYGTSAFVCSICFAAVFETGVEPEKNRTAHRDWHLQHQT